MAPKRPPTTDADYRVVHEPWPRWMLQLSLLKLVLWGAGVTTLVMIGGLLLLGLFSALG